MLFVSWLLAHSLPTGCSEEPKKTKGKVIAKQVRQDTQLAMTFPFVAFCHYSEQFRVSQAEQFSDGLSGQKHYMKKPILHYLNVSFSK